MKKNLKNKYMKHTVYFELFGKKMKTVVFAESKEHATQMITDKIIFHKIEAEPIDDFERFINHIFSFLRNNKPKTI